MSWVEVERKVKQIIIKWTIWEREKSKKGDRGRLDFYFIDSNSGFSLQNGGFTVGDKKICSR